MTQIKMLTEDQERALLIALCDESKAVQMDSGAGRTVFDVYPDTFVGLGIDVPCTCVVKVALGIPGMNQNEVECNAYENYIDLGYPLARIFYRGQFVEIMERVATLESDCGRDYDEYSSADEFADAKYDEGLPDEVLYDIWNTAARLEDINGSTGDNGQLGYNDANELVAYDYGYEANSTTSFCSDLDGNNLEDMQLYIPQLAQLVGSDSAYISDLEAQLIQ